MIQQGNPYIMGAIATAICIPPLGVGLATKLCPRLWSDEEQDAGSAALAMGLIGITEGAIPFAVADPIRVIPSIMTGSAIGAAIAMMGGVADYAPHGGPIVLPVIDHRFIYLGAIFTGLLITAVLLLLSKTAFNKHNSLVKPDTTTSTIIAENSLKRTIKEDL